MLTPSRVMLVDDVRPPLIDVFWFGFDAEPACVSINDSGFLAASGSSVICRLLIVELNSAFVELMRSAPAVTVTDSLTLPISRATESEYSCAAWIVTFATEVLKPEA